MYGVNCFKIWLLSFSFSLSRTLLCKWAVTHYSVYQWQRRAWSAGWYSWIPFNHWQCKRGFTIWSAGFTDCIWRSHPVCSPQCFTRIHFTESPLKHCHQMNKELQILLNGFLSSQQMVELDGLNYTRKREMHVSAVHTLLYQLQKQ